MAYTVALLSGFPPRASDSRLLNATACSERNLLKTPVAGGLLELRQGARGGVHARLTPSSGFSQIDEVLGFTRSFAALCGVMMRPQLLKSLFTVAFVLSPMCRGPLGDMPTIDASVDGNRFGLTLRYMTEPHREHSATS